MICHLLCRFRVLCLSSFFFARLSNDDQSQTPTHTYQYGRVSTWGALSQVNVFTDLDCLIVPINERQGHWFPVVLDFRNRTMSMYDTFTTDHRLNNPRDGFANTVKTFFLRWLKDEYQRLTGHDDYDTGAWTFPFDGHPPQQTDQVSCGVLTMVNAEILSTDRWVSCEAARMLVHGWNTALGLLVFISCLCMSADHWTTVEFQPSKWWDRPDRKSCCRW
jgi:Ulp1 family protease